MDWTNARLVIRMLAVPRQRIILMPHAVPNVSEFFESVAAAMRRLAAAL